VTQFAVLLDEQPLTWERLAGEWRSRAPEGRLRLLDVCPVAFDVAEELAPAEAYGLVLWLTRWLPTSRVLVIPQFGPGVPRRPWCEARWRLRPSCG
jgi:hypothetical protein